MHTEEVKQLFEKQVKEHEALIHKICRMYAYVDADRQDLFQDIVIQLWRAYPGFKGNSKFSTWLYKVAINTAITGLRKKDKMISYYQPAELPVRVDNNTSREEEQRVQQLYKAIEQLNEVEKAVVMLYMEDNSYEEMEEILGVSSSTLRVKMNRIKDKLRNLTKSVDDGTR